VTLEGSTPSRAAELEDKSAKARRLSAKEFEGNTFRCKSGVFLHPDVT
jgi:hypothetical protein